MPKTKLEQWLNKIEASHPVDIDMGLERIASVAKSLEIDLSTSLVISVAGTNGKGSTCKLIENTLLAAGLTCGVYSSPHFHRFNERIRLNDLDSSDEAIVDAFERIDVARGRTSLTYFEYATLAALIIFMNAKLDVIILEVGLGGRLDATNIIDADLAVLTSIGLDHQSYLGDSLEQIAFEKAGIVKAKETQRLVIGFSERYALAEKHIEGQFAYFVDGLANESSIQATSDEDNDKAKPNTSIKSILRAGEDFRLKRSVLSGKEKGEVYGLGELHIANTDVSYTWTKAHIPEQNIMTAIAALWQVNTILAAAKQTQAQDIGDLLKQAAALAKIIESTKMTGRAQFIKASASHPNILLDVAHNEDSARYLAKRIGNFDFARCHIVVGMLKDKNIEQSLALLEATLRDLAAQEAFSKKTSFDSIHWHCATLPAPRGEKGERLSNALASSANKQAYSSLEAAFSNAIEQASNTDMIVVFGSFVTVSLALSYLEQIHH